MNRYKYKAIKATGEYVNGKMMADNPAELLSMLRSTKLELISYEVKNSRSSFSVFERIKTKDLVTMFIHLEQLDKAGVPIVDSISDLKDTSDSTKVRNLMHEIHESIKKGSLFSESLAKHPEIFSTVYVGLIAAGEKTGKLAQAFSSIVDDLKWSSDLKRKTTKATIGPMFGLLVMVAVMAVMMGIVVPKVTGFLLMQSISMPAATIALIAFSNFVQGYWLVLLLFVPILMMVIKILRKSPEVEVKIDTIKLKIPVFGPIMVKIDSAKFCQFFAMTFKSGLGVIECLDAAGMVVSNAAMRRSILVVKQQVSDGQSLAKAIAYSGLFPSLVVRMFKVGEDSGNMSDALQNIQFFYDREINDSIDRLVGMIQPTLTFVMGGMIAWVTIAVFGPIYGSFANIK
ncbi:MAG: type II secretion system F family protein [Rickettsiales bacterium]|nr:type II secretion system F family protein [Rickettsiales bacterium]